MFLSNSIEARGHNITLVLAGKFGPDVASAGADMITALSQRPVGAAAVPDAWIRNGQNGERQSGVKRSLDGFREGAGGQGWLPVVWGKPAIPNE